MSEPLIAMMTLINMIEKFHTQSYFFHGNHFYHSHQRFRQVYFTVQVYGIKLRDKVAKDRDMIGHIIHFREQCVL